jgi:hypothetical protein
MTYKKNFVVAIKVNGKILRESAEEVQLPFGSEYSVLLKNLNPVRAMAQIAIDGKEATTWLILPANGTVDVERFLRSDNLKQGNRFKFVERTQAVENHRGIQLEDGLIRVEFKKERVFELPKVVEHHEYHHYDNYPWKYIPAPQWPSRPPITWCSTPSISSGSVSGLNNLSFSVHAQNMMSAQCKSTDENTAGITAPGSLSNQKFVSVSGFQTEQSEVITIKLTGHHGSSKVQKPLTVDIRIVCQTCGKRAKGLAKFCSGCGASLQII